MKTKLIQKIKSRRELNKAFKRMASGKSEIIVKFKKDETPLIQKIKEELRNKFYESCKGRFNCGRDWEAWQIGTMTVDDFSPLEEDDDFIDELSEIAIKAISQSKEELVEEIKKKLRKEIMFNNNRITKTTSHWNEQDWTFYGKREALKDFLEKLSNK